jgi:hypothetical protein
MIPKPSRTEFMLAGFELSETLDIRARWETLDANEIRALALRLDCLHDLRDGSNEFNVLRPVFGRRP